MILPKKLFIPRISVLINLAILSKGCVDFLILNFRKIRLQKYNYARLNKRFLNTSDFAEQKFQDGFFHHSMHPRVSFVKDQNNKYLCNGCYYCVKTCPANCITIETEYDQNSKERRASKVDIDFDLCIDCGACVEACPYVAIR